MIQSNSHQKKSTNYKEINLIKITDNFKKQIKNNIQKSKPKHQKSKYWNISNETNQTSLQKSLEHSSYINNFSKNNENSINFTSELVSVEEALDQQLQTIQKSVYFDETENQQTQLLPSIKKSIKVDKEKFGTFKNSRNFELNFKTKILQQNSLQKLENTNFLFQDYKLEKNKSQISFKDQLKFQNYSLILENYNMRINKKTLTEANSHNISIENNSNHFIDLSNPRKFENSIQSFKKSDVADSKRFQTLNTEKYILDYSDFDKRQPSKINIQFKPDDPYNMKEKRISINQKSEKNSIKEEKIQGKNFFFKNENDQKHKGSILQLNEKLQDFEEQFNEQPFESAFNKKFKVNRLLNKKESLYSNFKNSPTHFSKFNSVDTSLINTEKKLLKDNIQKLPILNGESIQIVQQNNQVFQKQNLSKLPMQAQKNLKNDQTDNIVQFKNNEIILNLKNQRDEQKHFQTIQKQRSELLYVPRKPSIQKIDYENIYKDLLHSSSLKHIQNLRNSSSLQSNGKLINDQTEFNKNLKLNLLKNQSQGNLGIERFNVKQVKIQKINNQNILHQHSFNEGKDFHFKIYERNLKQRDNQINDIMKQQMEKCEDFQSIINNVENRQIKLKIRHDMKLKENQRLRYLYKLYALSDFKNNLDLNEQVTQNIDYLSKARKLMNASSVDFSKSMINFDVLKSQRSQSANQAKKHEQYFLEEQVSEFDESKVETDSIYNGILTTDDINFQYKEHITRCLKCSQVNYNHLNLKIQKDAQHFEFLKKSRLLYKKPRIQAQDIQNLNGKIVVKQKRNEEREQRLKMVNPELLRQEKDQQTFEKMKKLYEEFIDWQKQMWVNVKLRFKEKEKESKPRFMHIFDQLRKENYDNLLIEFKLREEQDMQSLESIWVPQKQLADLRKEIKHLVLNGENIGYEEFIECILMIKDKTERQTYFFDQVKDLLIFTSKKSFSEQYQDGELPDKDHQEQSFQTKFIDQIAFNKENKQNFLQKKLKIANQSKIYDNQENADTEYAKNCIINNEVSLPQIIKPPELIDGKYIVINQHITNGLMKSIADSFKFLNYQIHQIFLSNNDLEKDQIAYFIDKMSESQKKQIKSIVIRGPNQFSKKDCDSLISNFLKNENNLNLIEFRLIDINLTDNGLCKQILDKLLAEDMKIRILSLAKLQFENDSFEQLLIFLLAAIPSLKNLDLSWNKFTTKQMKEIILAICKNNNLQYLNISFNPCSQTDKLKLFGNYIRQNSKLQHLDISGVLQTKEQVRRIVKKFKKSQSLLSIHLNHTHCIANNFKLQKYIEKKLQFRSKIYSVMHTELDKQRKNLRFKVPEDMESLVGLKFKYELIQNARAQARDFQYYSAQQINQPFVFNKKSDFIIQRTLAHKEIRGNRSWILSDDCYCCQRWIYTLFVFHFEHQEFQDLQIEGTFELMGHQEGEKIRMIDVREFARIITEISGDFEVDFERFLRLLKDEEGYKIELNEQKMEELKLQFKQ